MLRTPDFYGYFTATVNPLKRLSASLSGTYTGSMLVGRAGIDKGPGVREPVALYTPEFFTLSLKMAYDIPVYKLVTLQVCAGIQNNTDACLDDFDKGWNRDSGYIYGPGMPKSYFVGAKINY